MGNDFQCCRDNNVLVHETPYLEHHRNIRKGRLFYSGKEEKESILDKINNPIVVYDNTDTNNQYTISTPDLINNNIEKYDSISYSIDKSRNPHLAEFKPINLDFKTNLDEDDLDLLESQESKEIDEKVYDKSIKTIEILDEDNKNDYINEKQGVRFSSKAEKSSRNFKNKGYGITWNGKTNEMSTDIAKTKNMSMNEKSGYLIEHISFKECSKYILEEQGIDVSNFMKDYLNNREKHIKPITKYYCISKAPISDEVLEKYFPLENIKYTKGIYFKTDENLKDIDFGYMTDGNNNQEKENDSLLDFSKSFSKINRRRDFIYWGELNLKSEKHGFGTLLFNNGVKYNGYWINNKFDLFGRKVDVDGTISEGFFKNFSLNGKGYQSTLISNYKGDFKNGMKHGFGELKTDNELYIGDFENNMRNGFGKLLFHQSGNKYEGNFVNDKIEGEGTYRWSFGDYYTGEFKNGVLNGYGIYKWLNGDIYEGFYQNGLRWGQGSLTNANGNSYVGNFQDNVPHGKGTITRKGKEPIIVEFINGVQLKKTFITSGKK